MGFGVRHGEGGWFIQTDQFPNKPFEYRRVPTTVKGNKKIQPKLGLTICCTGYIVATVPATRVA